MFLVSKSIQSFEHKLEQGFQVLGAWTRDEYVGITVSQGSGDRQTKGSTLTTPTGSSKRNSRRQSFLGNGVDECKYGLCLIDGFSKLDEIPGGFDVLQRFSELPKLILGGVRLFSFPRCIFDRLDVLST